MLSTRKLGAAAFVLAALVAAISLGGILIPSLYARETPSWAAQALGQDWFDLVILAPLLAVCGAAVRRGSRAALVLLAGALVFAVYELVIYTLAVRFNALFLGYCAAFGLSFYTLAAAARALGREKTGSWYDGGAPVRTLGGFLVGSGVVFYLLWLGQVVPALLRGTAPSALDDTGLATNPVHVLDLSIVLPAIIAAGLSLLRRRELGYGLGPVMMAFSALMFLSIGELFLVMRLRGLPADLGLAAVFGGLALAGAALTARMLRHLVPETA